LGEVQDVEAMNPPDGKVMKNFKALKFLLPSRHEQFLVFGLVLFLVHSWSVYKFLYKAPSLLLYMTLDQMAAVLAYMMAFAFLESLLLTGVLILIAILVPWQGFRTQFVPKVFLTLAVTGFTAVDLMNSLTNKYPGIGFLWQKYWVTGVVLLGLLLMAHFVKPVQKILYWLAEQISVMVYFYASIGVFSLLVVVIRNIL